MSHIYDYEKSGRDRYDDLHVIQASAIDSVIFLELFGEDEDSSVLHAYTSDAARKLARRLKKAADTVDGLR